jgi:hypothetical protein
VKTGKLAQLTQTPAVQSVWVVEGSEDSPANGMVTSKPVTHQPVELFVIVYCPSLPSDGAVSLNTKSEGLGPADATAPPFATLLADALTKTEES